MALRDYAVRDMNGWKVSDMAVNGVNEVAPRPISAHTVFQNKLYCDTQLLCGLW